MGIEAIREGVEASLSTVDGLRVQQEWERAPNVSGAATVAVVSFGGADYDQVMGGSPSEGANGDDMSLSITLLVPKTREGRRRLDALVDTDPASTTSIRNTLDPTLDGAVSWAIVRNASGYREYGPEEQPLLGCELTVGIGT